LKTLDLIDKALEKTYRKDVLTPFIKAINDYKLIEENDKIAVCISGGKDSLILAKLFQRLKVHNKFNFELEFISMDPGYLAENRRLLESNCENLGIPIKIFNSDIFEVVEKVSGDYPCYLCARMRRGFLYKAASDLGCNKIALAHHMDDVIETTLINMFYGSQFKTMIPKLDAKNFPNMTLIRPLFYIREKDIIRFQNFCEFESIDCGCVVACHKYSSKRYEVKQLIKQLEKIDKKIPLSIFNSASNINLLAVLGYFNENKKTSFEDVYQNRKDSIEEKE
jgi:tRNA(Ile)-lysidine synthase TilS/MesJ